MTRPNRNDYFTLCGYERALDKYLTNIEANARRYEYLKNGGLLDVFDFDCWYQPIGLDGFNCVDSEKLDAEIDKLLSNQNEEIIP